MATVDIATILNRSEIEALKDLIALRDISTRSLAERSLPLQSPVHPLLLASALSLYHLKKEDYHSLLENYILCTPPEGSRFEELLRLPPFGSEEELGMFLDIEEKYVEAIIYIALIVSLPAPPSLLNSMIEAVQNYPNEYKFESRLKDAIPNFVQWHIAEKLRGQGLTEFSTFSLDTLTKNLMWRTRLNDFPIKAKLMILNRTPHYIFELVLQHPTYGPIFEKNPSTEVIYDFLKDCWQNIDNSEDRRINVIKFQVILNAWTAFNPMYLFSKRVGYLKNGLWRGLEGYMKYLFQYNPPVTDEEISIFYADDLNPYIDFLKYGKKVHDSFIHTIKYYELYKGSVQGQYNSILRSSDPQEEKKKALLGMRLRLSNASRLVQRASRFYYWDPGELDAKSKVLLWDNNRYTLKKLRHKRDG